MNLHEKIEKLKTSKARLRMYYEELDELEEMKMSLSSMRMEYDPIHTRHPDISPRTRRVEEQIDAVKDSIDKEIELTLELKTDITSVIENSLLEEREKTVLRSKYRDNMTDKRIGKLIGRSEPTVRRIRKGALKKLVKMIGDDQ